MKRKRKRGTKRTSGKGRRPKPSQELKGGRSARVAELESRLTRLSKGEFSTRSSDNCSLEVAESHLEDILAFESVAEGPSLFQGLLEKGIPLPNPDDLADRQCGRKVFQILKALARIQVFIIGLDHLGPREAYTKLWRETLWEACYVEKKTPGALTVMDASHSLSRAEMNRFITELVQQGQRVN